MAKYVDVEQVCLWLQPLNDRVIAMTGEASESQCRIQKQLAKVVQSHYKSGELEQEYDGNYLIQVSQENYNLEAFVLVSQSLLTATQKTLIRTLLIIMGAMILAIMVIVLFVSQWMTSCRRDEQHYHADQGRRNPASGAARRMVPGADYAGYGI